MTFWPLIVLLRQSRELRNGWEEGVLESLDHWVTNYFLPILLYYPTILRYPTAASTVSTTRQRILCRLTTFFYCLRLNTSIPTNTPHPLFYSSFPASNRGFAGWKYNHNIQEGEEEEIEEERKKGKKKKNTLTLPVCELISVFPSLFPSP